MHTVQDFAKDKQEPEMYAQATEHIISIYSMHMTNY